MAKRKKGAATLSGASTDNVQVLLDRNNKRRAQAASGRPSRYARDRAVAKASDTCGASAAPREEDEEANVQPPAAEARSEGQPECRDRGDDGAPEAEREDTGWEWEENGEEMPGEEDWEEASAGGEWEAIPGILADDAIEISSAEEDTAQEAEGNGADRASSQQLRRARLMCLLARGLLTERAAWSPVLQAQLLSLLPLELTSRLGNASASGGSLALQHIQAVAAWFSDTFSLMAVPEAADEGQRKADSPLSHPLEVIAAELSAALETHKGTAEQLAALSAAVFRALGCTVRLVAVLEANPRKPTAKLLRYLAKATRDTSGAEASEEKPSVGGNRSRGASRAGRAVNPGRGSKQRKGWSQQQQRSQTSRVKEEPPRETEDREPRAARKRKGDLEIERQIEMAMEATAIASSQSPGKPSRDHSTSSRAQRGRGRGAGWTRWDRQAVMVSAAEKARAMLRSEQQCRYWLEVFCGEAAKMQWLHVDCLQGWVDMPSRVQLLSRFPGVTYAVAFRGGGAKDVTVKYSSTAKRATTRADEGWWEETLRPLRRIESSADAAGPCSVVVHPTPSQGTSRVSSASGADGSSWRMPAAAAAAAAAAASESSSAVATAAREATEREDKMIAEKKKEAARSLPTTVEGFKGHEVFVLKRHIGKYQGLVPGTKFAGMHKGEAFYLRSALSELHTADRWRREGRVVRPDELDKPVKVEKRRKVPSRPPPGAGGGRWGRNPYGGWGGRGQFSKPPPAPVKVAAEPEEADSEAGGAGEDSKKQTVLFGEWQTDEMKMETAKDGIVPKNERGQVDCPPYASVLPGGTVHVALRGSAAICRRLKVDYAPAMCGFEIRSGRSVPKIDGVVVCEEHAEAVRVTHAEAKAQAEAKARRKERDTCDRAWRVLLNAVWMRVKLSQAEKLENTNASKSQTKKPGKPSGAKGGKGGRTGGSRRDSNQSAASHQLRDSADEPAGSKPLVTVESLDQPIRDGYASDVDFEEI